MVVRGDNLLGGEFFATEETEEEFHPALRVVSVPVGVVWVDKTNRGKSTRPDKLRQDKS